MEKQQLPILLSWFDWTGARTHYLPYSWRASESLYHSWRAS